MAVDYIVKNLAQVQAQAQAAMQEAKRSSPCTLLAAVKYALPGELEALLEAGVTDVGENRVQQLMANADTYAAYGTRVHFIGSLQTNKVKYIIDKVHMIHSVDSLRLAEEIEKRAAAKGLVINVLVEINSGREESKSGVLPEQAEDLCRALLALPHLRLCGFMTMGPRFESEADYRAYFAQTVALGATLWHTLGMEGEPLYSMGMSESFAAAIKEGASFVRVGRRLFYGRPEADQNG